MFKTCWRWETGGGYLASAANRTTGCGDGARQGSDAAGGLRASHFPRNMDAGLPYTTSSRIRQGDVAMMTMSQCTLMSACLHAYSSAVPNRYQVLSIN